MIGRRIEWEIYGCIFRGTVISVYLDGATVTKGMVCVAVDRDTLIISRDSENPLANVFPPGHPDHRSSRWIDD